MMSHPGPLSVIFGDVAGEARAVKAENLVADVLRSEPSREHDKPIFAADTPQLDGMPAKAPGVVSPVGT